MMNAFKCDGCLEYQAGEPLFTITTYVVEFTETGEWHCCAWSCIEELAARKREEYRSRSRHPSTLREVPQDE